MRARKTTTASAGPAGRGAHGINANRASHAAASADSVEGRAPIRTLTAELEAELGDIAAAVGCELLHIEWKGGILRLILDRAETAAQTPAAAWSAPPLVSPADAAELPAADSDPGEVGMPPALPGAPGVSLGDCERVAKQAGALLDVLDFGNGRYTLEVSSPGLDRQLYSPRDYERFVGKLARVTYELAAPAPSPTSALVPTVPTVPTAPAQPGAQAKRGNGRAALASHPGQAQPAAPPVRPARRTVVARLAEFQPAAQQGGAGGQVTLQDERTGERLTLPLSCIRMARLEVEL